MDVIVVAREAGRRESLTRLARDAGWTIRHRVAEVGALDDTTADDADLLLVEAADIRAARVARGLVAGRVVVTVSAEEDVVAALASWDLHGWAAVPPAADPHALNSAASAAVDGFVATSGPRGRVDAGVATRTVAIETDLRDLSVEALTPRERTVLELMADGLSNKQIAARLVITDHTAKFHVASILGKLGVSTRAAAVRRGLRRGWVSL